MEVTAPELVSTDVVLFSLIILFIYYDYLGFYVPLKNFSLIYGDVTNAGEGLQNLGLSSALGAFEQGGIFIVPHLM